jgi:serine/threonine protein kinase
MVKISEKVTNRVNKILGINNPPNGFNHQLRISVPQTRSRYTITEREFYKKILENLGKLLGRGTYSDVYIVKSVGIPTYVAKLFNNHPAKILVMRHEINIVAKLHREGESIHNMPKIKAILPMGAIVMQKAPGDELFNILYVHKKKLTFGQKKAIIMGLIDHCLDCLNHGLVNLDLKMENIMFNPTTCEMLVVDYGSLVHTDSFSSVDPRSFTPEYAPSQFFFSGSKASQRAGVYIAATIIWELLSGHLPYIEKCSKSRGWIEVKKSICDQDINPEADGLKVCLSQTSMSNNNIQNMVTALQQGLNPVESNRPTFLDFSKAVLDALTNI